MTDMLTRRAFIVGSSGLLVPSHARARPVIIDINALFPQTKAIIAAMSPAPTNSRIAIINSTVGLLLRSGLWGGLDVLYMTAAATAQAASINWKTPGSNSLVQVGTVSFVADRGFTSDGTTGYFTTGYTPSTAGGVFVQDSAHIGAWILTSTASAGEELTINAADFSQPAAQFTARTPSNFLRGVVNGTTPTNLNAITDASGHSGISRIGSNNSYGFKNGAAVGPADPTASIGVTAGNLYICGTPMYGLSTKQIAAAHIGDGLTSTQIASLYTALFTYMHAVGVA